MRVVASKERAIELAQEFFSEHFDCSLTSVDKSEWLMWMTCPDHDVWDFVTVEGHEEEAIAKLRGTRGIRRVV